MVIKIKKYILVALLLLNLTMTILLDAHAQLFLNIFKLTFNLKEMRDNR